jgi:hypothetical protein
MRLRSRPTLAVAAVLILAIGAGIAGIAGIALGSAAVGRDGTAGLACADVAPATGLDFRGDYGAAFGTPAPRATGCSRTSATAPRWATTTATAGSTSSF